MRLPGITLICTVNEFCTRLQNQPEAGQSCSKDGTQEKEMGLQLDMRNWRCLVSDG